MHKYSIKLMSYLVLHINGRMVGDRLSGKERDTRSSPLDVICENALFAIEGNASNPSATLIFYYKPPFKLSRFALISSIVLFRLLRFLAKSFCCLPDHTCTVFSPKSASTVTQMGYRFVRYGTISLSGNTCRTHWAAAVSS